MPEATQPPDGDAEIPMQICLTLDLVLLTGRGRSNTMSRPKLLSVRGQPGGKSQPLGQPAAISSDAGREGTGLEHQGWGVTQEGKDGPAPGSWQPGYHGLLTPAS